MTIVSPLGALQTRALPAPAATAMRDDAPPPPLRGAPTELATAVQPASATLMMRCTGNPAPDELDNVPQPGDAAVLVDDWEPPGPSAKGAEAPGSAPGAPADRALLAAWQDSLHILRGG